MKTNFEKKFEKWNKIDVIGKNYFYMRDNLKHDIPLTGKFNKEANDYGLVH